MTTAAANVPMSIVDDGRCLGRSRELEQIIGFLDDAAAGRGPFVLVTGQPGAGKSTLLNAAQTLLRDKGALVLSTRCRPGLASFRPLLEIVRAALEISCEAGCGRAPANDALLEVLAGRAPAADALGDRIALFDQIAGLLTSVSRIGSVVIAIHDLDVADAATRKLVFYLARVLTSAPMLSRRDFRGFVIASAASAETFRHEQSGDDSRGSRWADSTLGRPDLRPQASRWSDGVNLERVDLGGLDASGIRAFLSADRTIERVLKATGGVPRLLDALLDLPRPDDLSVLRQLEPSDADLLQLLAVFGRPLGPETLRLIGRLPHGALARSIARLTERGIIEKLVVDGELRVGIARVGDRQAIYDAIEPPERARLHAEVGHYLSQRPAEAEAAAHHLLHGRCGDEAVEAALTAAQQLEIAYCPERAADLYQRAYAQATAVARRREIVEKLCALHERTGELGRALQHAEHLRRTSPEDPAIVLRIARLHLRRGDFSATRAALADLSKILDAETHPGMRLQALALAAEARYHAGEIDAAASTAREGIELFQATCSDEETLGPDERQAWISLQNTFAFVQLERERYLEARQLFAANLRTAQDAGLDSEVVRAMIQLGLTHMRCGDYPEAERYYRRARRYAEATGEHRYLGATLQHLGVLAERRREYDRALCCYQEAVNVWKKVGHRSYLAWVGLDLGKLYLDLGDVARATAMVGLADRLLDAEPPAVTQINLELLRGRLAEREHRFGEAHDRYVRARALAAAAGQPEHDKRALLRQVELLTRRGEHERARRLLEQSGLPGHGGVRIRLLLARAELSLQTAELDAAECDLAEALELSTHLRDPEARWRAKFQLAEIARRRGRSAEARRLLEEASAIEEQVRRSVPEDLLATFAEQPRRVALRAALAGAAAPLGPTPLGIVPLAPTAAIAPSPRPARRRNHEITSPIIGEHARIQHVLDQVEKVGPTDALVLLRGESGTGKELVADAIHRFSTRARRPLIKVNCGALVESLLLSELFGHERGAFTGATQRKVGRFEAADGGTIFLDEIADISPKTQVALLRVLQERNFERVGGTQQIKVDVRIICATNRDLEQMVAQGQFREDLYYRLRGVQIDLPALRDRPSDIPLLTTHFLARIADERDGRIPAFSEAAMATLCQHSWPGNVRELENVLRSVSLFADNDVVDLADFSDYPELRRPQLAAEPEDAVEPAPAADLGHDAYEQLRASGLSLRDLKKRVEVDCIQRALDEVGGNITRAAELLGMKRPRLSQLIKEHGLSAR